MASTPLSARGAVDLGALATARQNQQKADAAMATAPPGVVVDVTAASFEAEVVVRSQDVPVVVVLWMEGSEPCRVLVPVLERLAAEAGGRWVLAKVDVDAEPEVGAAFQVQSIPSVVAVIGGRPLPLFPGAIPEAQIRQVLDELLRVAAEEGVAGTIAGADADPASGEEQEPPVDPRFDAAVEAFEAGDWEGAERAYRTVLASEPSDPDAIAGVALVGLYRRMDGQEPPATTDSDADALLAADFAALDMDWPTAFDLGIAVVRRTSGDEREAARLRVVDYFLIAGDDPAVIKARSALASALF